MLALTLCPMIKIMGQDYNSVDIQITKDGNEIEFASLILNTIPVECLLMSVTISESEISWRLLAPRVLSELMVTGGEATILN